MIRTKSIYEPRSDRDGLRILVTRYWPRGVNKQAVDAWFKDLGPEPKLIKEFKHGSMGWADFKKRYVQECMGQAKKAALNELKKFIKDKGAEDITILCMCREEDKCHRSLLKPLIMK
jgi:uncharacterized protein YeaO (DUF488 family)